MTPTPDVPINVRHPDTEAATPLSTVVIVQQYVPESLANTRAVVGRFSSSDPWSALRLPFSEAGAAPVASFRELTGQLGDDVGLDYQPPNVPKSRIMLRARRAAWPTPEWEY